MPSALERMLLGLAVIAAVSVLAAIGTITGSQALNVIIGVASLLLGGSLALATPASSSRASSSSGVPGSV